MKIRYGLDNIGFVEKSTAENLMQSVCIEPYRTAADAVLRFTKKNICSQAEYSDISFTPRNADISVRLIPYRVEPDTEKINRLLCADMPSDEGISILKSAYTESGYINFSVRDDFLTECAEKINSALPDIPVPQIIELPLSPEYAVIKLMNTARLCGAAPLSQCEHRALWLCLGLAGDLDKTVLKRRLRAASAACISVCSAENSALGGKTAEAMAKLIAYSVDKSGKL